MKEADCLFYNKNTWTKLPRPGSNRDMSAIFVFMALSILAEAPCRREGIRTTMRI